MPGMDGYELIDHLRTSGFTMPILIITAKERFEDNQRLSGRARMTTW